MTSSSPYLDCSSKKLTIIDHTQIPNDDLTAFSKITAAKENGTLYFVAEVVSTTSVPILLLDGVTCIYIGKPCSLEYNI